MKSLFSVLTAILFLTNPFTVLAEGNSKSASDLYVGCYLFAHNTSSYQRADGNPEAFSGEQCAATLLGAFVHLEGKDSSKTYRFCLSRDAQSRTEAMRAMAYAFIDYFENTPNIAAMNANAALALALQDKWPCKN